MLFPSLLQGEKVAESIGRQLERIRLVRSHFDAVAIIRGGGGDIGLSGYNQYELARHVALFPLPVITGIGHATNETVTEMVAFRNCITPTDLAGFLIQQFHNFSVPVKEARRIIVESGRQLLSDERRNLITAAGNFRSRIRDYLASSTRILIQHTTGIRGFGGFFIRTCREKLISEFRHLGNEACRLTHDRVTRIAELEKWVALLDPKRVLSRGYTITLHGRKFIRRATDVKPGDPLKTITFEGSILSTTNQIQPEPYHE
jgi:exodeoxyribonuclease VII large subunit